AQLVSKIRPEVHAAVGLWPHVGPGSAGENALRRRFAPSFKAEEEESTILTETWDRATHRASKIMLIVKWLMSAPLQILEWVCFKSGAAPVVERRSVEGFGACFSYHVHGAATRTTVTRIVSVSLNLYFLYCID